MSPQTPLDVHARHAASAHGVRATLMKIIFPEGWQGPVAPWVTRALLIVILVTGVGLRFFYSMSTTEWIDRDIQRAIGLATGTHRLLVGPELNSGGFLPGPFFYVLLDSVYAFTHSPYAAVYLNRVLHVASIVVFFWAIRRRYATFPTLVALGWLCFSTTHAWSFGSPINPAFLFFFNALMIWWIVKIFVEKRDGYLVPAMVTIALGAQIHLAFAAHLLSLAVLAFCIHRPRARVVGLSLLGALLTMAPYAAYRCLIRDVPLYRAYQQFTASQTLSQILPLNTFSRLFERAPLPVAEANIRSLADMIAPGWALPNVTQWVRSYLWLSWRFEFVMFVLALAVGTAALWCWGYRSRFRLSTHQRLLITPFLAIAPLILLWQWSGISRHGHSWYSFVFFPLLPWWMGTTCALVTERIKRPPWRRAAQACVMLGTLSLAPQTVMYHKTLFFFLDDVVADVRDVKHQLGLSLDRFREGVFFIDRPYRGDPKQDNPPFDYPPWGSYTDYMYQAVGAEAPASADDPGQCFLIGHKNMVESYSLPYYLAEIDHRFGVHPTTVVSSDRLVYFAYARPDHGNCFHNTTNAWVVSERLGGDIARVPKGRQSALIADTTAALPSAGGRQRMLKFAIADRTAMLPMTLQVFVEHHGGHARWRATLESAHLMGHLNTMSAYAGLFRPWPKLWLEDVEVILESGGGQQRLRFADGAIGVVLLTPLATPPADVDGGLAGKNVRLLLRYRVGVSGRYAGSGHNIQDLATENEQQQWWQTSHVLYEGPLL